MADAGAPIRFRAGGWRGVLGEEFTFPRARRVVRAVGSWLLDRGEAGSVLVAHDTRFLADRFANVAVALLREAGIDAVGVRGAVPIPVVARAVRRRRAAGALVFTASHNPAEYLGLKLLSCEGGALEVADLRRLESLSRRESAGPEGRGMSTRRPLECRRAYIGELVSQLDAEAIGRARPRVIYDAMHGSGAGVLDAALARAGARVEVLRPEPDPLFGGATPDPTPARLRDLARRVRASRQPCLGLATDGDADRYGVVDVDGRWLSETEAVALLVDELAREGRVRRGVGISLATGSLVERVAAAHGLAVTRFPMGFGHLSRALCAGQIDVAGDESGGFAWPPFAYDKDGMLAAALLAQIVARTRQPLRARLSELERAHGRAACGRGATPVDGVSQRAFERLLGRPPSRLRGAVVREVDDSDGLWLRFDDGFLLLRASATEPVFRVHAEAGGPARLRDRLRAGLALLGRAA
jgi:phosphomannomutase